MPRSGADGGFLSGLKQVLIPDPQPQQQQQQPSARGGSSDYGANAANNVLVDLAPRLVNSSAKILHPATISSHQASLQGAPSMHHHIPTDPTTLSLRRKLSYVRAGLALGRPNNPLQSWSDLSTQLYLRDRVDELLGLPIPAAPFSFAPTSANTSATLSLEAPPPKPDDPVPLIQGFRATIPAAQASKAERRRRRALVSERALGLGSGNKLGLRQRGDRARGLLAGGGGAGSSLGGISEFGEAEEEQNGSFEPPTIGRRSKSRRKGHGGGTASSGGSEADLPLESRADLEKDAKEVEGDMNNVAVRRALLNGQIKDVEGKMAALEKVREELRRGLLGLREEELELEDERTSSFPGCPFSSLSYLLDAESFPAQSKAYRLACNGSRSRRPLRVASRPVQL